jgi:hypothetical protein
LLKVTAGDLEGELIGRQSTADLSDRPATSGEALANRKNPFAALGEAPADLGGAVAAY